MSELKDLKRVRYLKDVNFDDLLKSHIALTSNGAASYADTPYLLKSLSNEAVVELSTDSVISTDAENTGVNAVNDSSKNVNKESNVTVQVEQGELQTLQSQIADLQKSLAQKDLEIAVEKSAQKFGAFELEKELISELSEAFQGEQAELVVKAFEAIKAKAADELKVAVEKAKEGAGETELQKSLSVEKGEGGEPEVEVEKTVKEKTMDILKARLEGVK